MSLAIWFSSFAACIERGEPLYTLRPAVVLSLFVGWKGCNGVRKELLLDGFKAV